MEVLVLLQHSPLVSLTITVVSEHVVLQSPSQGEVDVRLSQADVTSGHSLSHYHV